MPARYFSNVILETETAGARRDVPPLIRLIFYLRASNNSVLFAGMAVGEQQDTRLLYRELQGHRKKVGCKRIGLSW